MWALAGYLVIEVLFAVGFTRMMVQGSKRVAHQKAQRREFAQVRGAGAPQRGRGGFKMGRWEVEGLWDQNRQAPAFR